MKKSLKYLLLKRYLDMLFILLFVLMFGLFSYNFYKNLDYSRLERYKAVDMIFHSIDDSLKEKKDAISFLQTSAQLRLDMPDIDCDRLQKMVKKVPQKSYFSLDKITPSLHSNITGYGALKVDKEMCMAYSLTPLFEEVSQHTNDSTWIYYISQKGFINLYPYVRSEDFHLTKKDMQKECYTYGTPALNPKKELYWSPLYFDAGGLGLMVSIGKPVYHDDLFQGVVALDMTLNHLSELTSQLDVFKGASAIINTQHQVLAVSHKSNFTTKRIIKDEELFPLAYIQASDSLNDFIQIDDTCLYKRHFKNAPWVLVYTFSKNETAFFVLKKMLPLGLIFLFLLIGRLMVKKILSTQKELEILNSSLEKKVETKINELAIQKSKYETFFHKAGVGMCLLHASKIIDCNEMVVEMLGAKSKEKVLGHFILSFSPKMQPDGTRSLKKARVIQKSLLKKGEYGFEWQFKNLKGELFWADISSNITYINDQKVVQVVWKDITLRKNLEQNNKEQMSQLIHQSRLAQMGEMLSMISHQWRQPLSSIGMVASNMQIKIESGQLARGSEQEAQKSDLFLLERLGRIEKYIAYLSETIDDFRNFFKPQKSKTEFDINTLIDETIELIAPILASRGITIEKSYQADQRVYSFENEIKQVILNILNNAKDALIEAGCENPTIMIKSYYHDSSCIVEIEDNGGGIAQEHLKKIFDPYFSTKSKNGTGLGLYMSQTIIEKHCQGELTVTNSQRGARFKVALPFVSESVHEREDAIVSR